MITRMERPTATARGWPRRLAMRRYRAARKVFVLLVPTAASPKTRARYGLPCPEDALCLVLPAEALMPRGELRPRAQVPGGREPRHIDPDLGDDDGRGDRADAGDLIEMRRGLGERGQLCLDLGVDSGDVGVEGIDPRQHAR